MKIGCCAYSYRKPLTAGAMTLEEFLDACVALEFDGVELTSYYFPSTERSYLHSLKRACFVRGLEVSGSAVGSNFCNPDDAQRRADVDNAKRWLEHSSVLGAPVMRVFAGPVAEGETEQAAFDRCIGCIEELLPVAEANGVVVAVENHGGITTTAEQVKRIVEAIGDHPWFGVNLDTGNYREPEREIPLTAPHTVTTHAKRTYRDPKGEKREVDWFAVRRALEEAGYRGFINMEYEEPEEPEVGVPDFMEKLKAAFRA